MRNSSIVYTHTHDNIDILDKFSYKDGKLYYDNKIIADSHIQSQVATENGVHGIRFYNSKLQYYDIANKIWKDITTSGGGGTFTISSQANNAIKKNSDGYYVEKFIISSSSNNALSKLANGYFVPAFLISKQSNNALQKYSDGYYVPALPVNNATIEDIEDAKDDLKTTINNNNIIINQKYDSVIQKLDIITQSITKQQTHIFTGNDINLGLVVDISTLYNSTSNVILSMEIMIKNNSNTDLLSVNFKEYDIQTMDSNLQPEEVQKYKLTNIPEIKIFAKGDYIMYLYVNYI